MAQVETSSSRKFQVKEVGPCKFQVSVEVPPDDVKARLDGRYRELNDTVALPGFRRGHVPRRLLEKRFGEEVAAEIKVALIGDSLKQVREEHQLSPVGDPDIDLAAVTLSDAAACAFAYTIEVKPTITFADYKGIPATTPKVTVADPDVQATIDRLLEAKAALVVAPDGRVADGDQIIADLDVALDGAPYQKQENVAFFIDKSLSVFNQPAPDLARALLGKRGGETAEVPLAFPKDHPDAKLAGREIRVTVRVSDVKRRAVPTLDDAWAKEMGFEGVAALQDRVRERLRQEKEEEARREVEEQILAEIRKRAGIVLPEGLVQKGSRDLLRRWAIDLYSQGVPESEIEKRVQEQQAASKDAVAVGMQTHFLVEHIAGREKIFVTESEIEDRVTQMASRYGRWPHEVKKYLEANDLLSDLRRKMREEKVRAFLVEHAKLGSPD